MTKTINDQLSAASQDFFFAISLDAWFAEQLSG